MKNAKNLTREQKEYLTKAGLKPKDFKVIKNTSEIYIFQNLHTGMLWKMFKDGGEGFNV